MQSDIFSAFTGLEKQINHIPSVRPFGKVVEVSGLVVACKGLQGVAMAGRCRIEDAAGHKHVAEVVGFRDDKILLMPFGSVEGIGPGCRVYHISNRPTFIMNDSVVGRVLNGLGEPIDGLGPLDKVGQEMPLKAAAPPAGQRHAVGPKMDLGVKVMNTFVPLCEGQRMGIFAGSGVGKSVLMSLISKFAVADVNVIGLVGERGREVREFLDEHLGPEGMKKTVVVVATGDESPLMRRQAAYLTMAAGEYFRGQGKKVMMMMDSVTRFAMAQREIGLSAGEPPTTKGYTPSVFSELPRLLERAGPAAEGAGSISGIFTVLVEGGDMEEPVADAVRGILDGHIVMTRRLAEQGRFPAVDVLKSVSRMMPHCHTEHQNHLVDRARQLMATYENMEELIRLGAYTQGSNPAVDEAIQFYDPLVTFLKQMDGRKATVEEGFQQLGQILEPLLVPAAPAEA